MRLKNRISFLLILIISVQGLKPKNVNTNTILKAIRTGLNCLELTSIKDSNYLLAVYLVRANLRTLLDNNSVLSYQHDSDVRSILGLAGDQQKDLRMCLPNAIKVSRRRKPIRHLEDRENNIDSLHSKTSHMMWNNYLKLTNGLMGWFPNPRQSDICLKEILTFNTTESNGQICLITNYCLRMLFKGSDYGYALTHRLLYMLFIKKTTKCFIFSPILDKRFVEILCTHALKEAKIISKNGFKAKDLFLEEVALCTMLGEDKFLTESWLNEIISWQNDFGCFDPGYEELSEFLKEHLTEVGVVALSSILSAVHGYPEL